MKRGWRTRLKKKFRDGIDGGLIGPINPKNLAFLKPFYKFHGISNHDGLIIPQPLNPVIRLWACFFAENFGISLKNSLYFQQNLQMPLFKGEPSYRNFKNSDDYLVKLPRLNF